MEPRFGDVYFEDVNMANRVVRLKTLLKRKGRNMRLYRYFSSEYRARLVWHGIVNMKGNVGNVVLEGSKA